MPSISLPTVALVAGGVGAGVSALGQLEQGQAVAREATYNAQVARNNAAYTSAAGSAQAVAESMRGSAVGGRVKAAIAANGVDVNSGSALKVQEGTSEANKVSTQNTENSALINAFGYQDEAGLQTAEAKQAPIGAAVGAAGGLLESASATGNKWSNMFGSDPLSRVGVTPSPVTGGF